MSEAFLHYIWKFRLFNTLELFAETGEKLEVLKTGEHNTNSGPDFFNANIRIGGTLWAGNVEIHVNASDWHKHGHPGDKAYDNTILHVVYVADATVFRSNGTEIPVLCIKQLFNEEIYHKYYVLQSSRDWVPCAKQIKQVDAFILGAWLERLLVERLEAKSNEIARLLGNNHNNWEETFYQALAKNFGFKLNGLAFELLAKSLPSLVLAKHKDMLFQLEALVFGQAGFLDGHFTDEYPQRLQNEYVFLRQKFSLHPVDKHLWKFLRLRPANFPSIRLAQFAQLVFRSSHLFSKIIETKDLTSLYGYFEVATSAYWTDHYLFDKPSKEKNKTLGKDAVDNIIINTIVPFLFAYGKKTGNAEYMERAIVFLEKTLPEKNNITQHWQGLKIDIPDAYRSQALIQLKNEYCQHKKCLDCAIGSSLIK